MLNLYYNQMQKMTLYELKELIDNLILEWLWDKIVYTANDEEYNWFHMLMWGHYSSETKLRDLDYNEDIEDYENSIILS